MFQIKVVQKMKNTHFMFHNALLKIVPFIRHREKMW